MFSSFGCQSRYGIYATFSFKIYMFKTCQTCIWTYMNAWSPFDTFGCAAKNLLASVHPRWTVHVDLKAPQEKSQNLGTGWHRLQMWVISIILGTFHINYADLKVSKTTELYKIQR